MPLSQMLGQGMQQQMPYQQMQQAPQQMMPMMNNPQLSQMLGSMPYFGNPFAVAGGNGGV
jgi:hypothetical protein